MSTRHGWTPPTQDMPPLPPPPPDPPPPPRMVTGGRATTTGLDPEQTIRDYAIGHVIARHAVNGAHLLQSQPWVQADEIAAYIRDGSRPDTAEEATTHG